MRSGLVVGAVIAIGYLFVTNLVFLQRAISRGSRVDELAKVGEWLRINTEPGEVVFNANWGWFPLLYYHSPKNYYLTGLEPRFSYVFNPSLYWLYDHIGRDGMVCDQEKCNDKLMSRQRAFRTEVGATQWYDVEGEEVAAALKDKLKTRYVVSSRGYGWLNQLMGRSRFFEEKFIDREHGYFIYQVK